MSFVCIHLYTAPVSFSENKYQKIDITKDIMHAMPINNTNGKAMLVQDVDIDVLRWMHKFMSLES